MAAPKNSDVNQALSVMRPGKRVPIDPKQADGPAVTVWPIALGQVEKFQALMEEAGQTVLRVSDKQTTPEFVRTLTEKLVPLLLTAGRDLMDECIDADYRLIPLPMLPRVAVAIIEQSLGLDEDENPFVAAMKTLSRKVLGRDLSPSEIASASSSLTGIRGKTSSTTGSQEPPTGDGPTRSSASSSSKQ